MKRRFHQGGFSLLEVIAAIAILAIAFAALMQVAGSSLSLTARANERTQAALRARTLLDGAFVMEPVREGVSDGRFDDTYRWRMNVTRYQPPGDVPPGDAQPGLDGGAGGMYRLDLDVIWGQGGGERHARFSTLRLAGSAGGNAP
ncbi:prepilin-type N-terminal cleavage/methylation domain-containing protein [Luteibacter yeojuensis]|uniref:Prepilin-type N-terminal cleavage/methylation domain-containing protein n=1 Tax=Luteibacter yeojuensis TaxID=345309 RepID=A0A7X5QVG1_9GAMM|nr:prepilin-type N-terminal cleavage/methylation domain-containing protein [Luteibacter yeojuensis]NID16162.1 prepilin-type N-terminal cleavage/methylation domain-containing protein [Luteibacter yeojuensis]